MHACMYVCACMRECVPDAFVIHYLNNERKPGKSKRKGLSIN